MSFSQLTQALQEIIEETPTLIMKGRVIQVIGTVIKAVLPHAKMGELCILQNPGQSHTLQAEVIGFSKQTVLLTPLGDMFGISPDTLVVATGRTHQVPVGAHLLGSVLDGLGNPIYKITKDIATVEKYYPVHADSPDPLKRQLIVAPLELGIKAIDGLLTCGEGQRLGLFAAAGGGKTTLMAMLVKNAQVDVVVVALIGERGREVREFIDNELGPTGMARTVLVVATSDKPAMERVKAAYVATAIAEFFRDQGKKVLLLMDSVTRFARAQREIGLAAGEAPTRRGFPSSVFSELPKLMERAGQSEKGSITAFYTVLVEGDDMTEPVADETRSILDGHIVLSRKLAAANHYPAIDILASLSRVMNQIINIEHRQAANRVRELLAKYDEMELLLKLGEYQSGNDTCADEALAKINPIRTLLRQDTSESIPFSNTLAQLQELATP
jgi:type III secretion protein N (ATPase)